MTNENNKKSTIIFAVVSAVLLLLCLVAGVSMAKCTFTAETRPSEATPQFVGIIDSADAATTTKLNDLRGQSELTEILKSWATNGNDAIKSKSGVLNFLLVCTDNGAIITNYGNADMIMLVSVNSNTKAVNIVSLDRDSFAYIPFDKGEVYAKLNAAYANTGAGLLRDTIQQAFKIKIDYYFTLSMENLTAIIDGMGGIQMPVDATVAGYCQEDFGESIPTDAQALTGTHIAYYLREKRDGNDSRSQRQCEVVAAIIKQSQKMGLGAKVSFLQVLAKNAHTDCLGSSALSCLRRTLISGWKTYTVATHVIPAADETVYYKNATWVRVLDYPVVSQTLQRLLFGDSNIALNTDRLSALEVIAAVNKVYEEASSKAAAEGTTKKAETTKADDEEDTTDEDEDLPEDDWGYDDEEPADDEDLVG